MEKIKTAWADAGAWVDGNPRKAVWAAFGVGFVLGGLVF